MARSSKKTVPPTKKSSTRKRKNSRTDRTGKKRRTTRQRHKKRTNGTIGRIVKIILFTILMVVLVAAAYMVGKKLDRQKAAEVTIQKRIKEHATEYEKQQKSPLSRKHDVEYQPLQKKERTKTVAKQVSTQDTHKEKSKREERSVSVTDTHTSPVELAYRNRKGRLAIIIDDIHTKAQLDTIKSLPFPVTPSIFPPYAQSSKTPRLATEVVHYMVHLPMESGKWKYDRQSKTLMRSFTASQMRQRIDELRRLFPRAYYINNHTGSKFTQDCHAMAILYNAMREDGFIFIDSLTTGRSCVRKIAHRYGDAYVSRDIFLDNKKEIGYIHTQLKKAVALAREHGFAIAIGHPHSVTFEALRRATWLQNEVEVVYIDALFRR